MSRIDRPVEVTIDTLELDGVDLLGEPEAFAGLVCDALHDLVDDRGLPPTRGSDAGLADDARTTDLPPGDGRLAREVAATVWQQLAVPAFGSERPA